MARSSPSFFDAFSQPPIPKSDLSPLYLSLRYERLPRATTRLACGQIMQSEAVPGVSKAAHIPTPLRRLLVCRNTGQADSSRRTNADRCGIARRLLRQQLPPLGTQETNSIAEAMQSAMRTLLALAMPHRFHLQPSLSRSRALSLIRPSQLLSSLATLAYTESGLQLYSYCQAVYGLRLNRSCLKPVDICLGITVGSDNIQSSKCFLEKVYWLINVSFFSVGANN